jgi:hypothetical protein
MWLLHRDPVVSIHEFDRVRRFDPHTSGAPHVSAWLDDHASRIEGEWFFPGVYLAFLE